MSQSPFFHYNCSFDAIDTMHRFAVESLESDPLYLTNFLGVKISTKFLPEILRGKEGEVESIPIPANWHADIAEWAFALRTVDLANRDYCIVELGCGWGCWLVNTGVAARSKDLKVTLIGIEGDIGHVNFAKEALAANNFDKDEYSIAHGIAGNSSGKALFPITESGIDWGSEPVLNPTQIEIETSQREQTHHVLNTYTMSDLASNNQIDLLHIDIQGGETTFVKENIDEIEKLVTRMLIGTHSRIIEGQIMTFLLDRGWTLEMERPAIFGLVNGLPQIKVDGVQGWLNPKR